MFIIAGVILNRQLRRDAVLAARVRGVQRAVGIEAVVAPTDASQSGVLRLVAGVGEAITRGGLLSASTLEDLELRLSTAGIRGRSALTAFIGAKLLALVGLPLLTLDRGCRMALVDAHRGDRRRGPGRDAAARLRGADIAQAPPQGRRARAAGCAGHAGDLQRGRMGLEPAIERVGREIGHAHQNVAEELLNTAREMRVNADRRAALMNMGTRTGLASLRRLGVTLVQTLQYGTPLSQALRTLSAEMRQEALTRFETRAGRLPALLTVPMIVFILPCVFLIVGGPAIVHVMQVMHQ